MSVKFKAESSSSFSVLYKDDDRMVIWGPASVEMVDKENDRITANALEDALPQLLKRKRLSLEHTDQLVGDILKGFETEEPVTVEIDGETFERSTFPTDVLYPEEDDVAHKGLYVAGEIYNDSRQSMEAREDIDDGILNSYSISGEAIESSTQVKDGELVDDIESMDLSAVTLCEEGMNQKSKFATFEPGTISAVAKQALVKAMTEKEGEGDESDEEESPSNASEAAAMDKSEMKELFRSTAEDVLKEHLPDGEIATKEKFEDWSSTSEQTEEKEEFADEPPEEDRPPMEDEMNQPEDDEEEEKALDNVTGRIEAAADAMGMSPADFASKLFAEGEDKAEMPVDDEEDEDLPLGEEMAQEGDEPPEDEPPEAPDEEEVEATDEEPEEEPPVDVDVDDVEDPGDDDEVEVNVEEEDGKSLDGETLDTLKSELPEDLYRGVTEHLGDSETQPMSDPEEKEESTESESEASEDASVEKSLDEAPEDLDDYLTTVSGSGAPAVQTDSVEKSFEHVDEETEADAEDDPTGALGSFYENN